MKKYEAPQAQIVSFDNDYVAASSRSRLAVEAFNLCTASQATWAYSDYACGPWDGNDG